ncbi:MAG: hypothetical protein HN742_26550 [Lentisphaerae bacterium]|nr:hypothetical protein [Lentisphaerota bacterium]MBT4820241.1 hypothetical protein [Lentisphaerota bacterium]MBT5606024.1 hypothetical protein [Lentisphaerota bacterium]MBT7058587.1 hypothetical protein [Lentisphaerota bacterium]MBT7845463.1 hypothetical protein [Lentisphaerota bacterium]
MRRLPVSIAAGALLAATSAVGANVWVSTHGNDEDAGTEQKPFRTVARGVHPLSKELF